VTSAHAPTARVLEPGDPDWPPLLSENVTPPVERLWLLGAPPATLGACVAIVGARNCSSYGLEIAHGLARDLATEGICIVSGLARGIDAAAHEGALAAGGTTIAVLGGGVDVIYPSASKDLYQRVLAAGALVSEKPLGTKPEKRFFPERNRIIAGLSHAAVIVQGELRTDGKKSGAMITANHANDCGRDVLAVPGDIRSILSAGPHQLIREGGSGICTGISDVYAHCPALKRDARRPEAKPLPEGLTPEQRALLEAMMVEPGRAEALANRAGVDQLAAIRVLTRLELQGLAARSPSGVYRRAR